MKTAQKLVIAAVVVAVLAVSGVAMAQELPYGSVDAAQDTNLTLNDMLTYAIQDEYMAQAEYKAIIAEYGNARPFANIVKAEGTHIAELSVLFQNNGVSLPADNAAQRVSAPSSLSAAYTVGADAEKANIAMYERFLKENLPADVQAVFKSLMAASQNHLNAFERVLGNGTAAGNAQYRMQANNGVCTGTCTQAGNGLCTGDCTQANTGAQYGRGAGPGRNR